MANGDAAGAPQQERALARRIVNAVFARRHALDHAEEWHVNSDRLSPEKAQEATREYEATWAEAEDRVLSLLAANSRSTSVPPEERQKLPTEEMIAAGMAAWGRIASGGKPEFAPPLTGQLGAETRVLVTAILSDALASHIRELR